MATASSATMREPVRKGSIARKSGGPGLWLALAVLIIVADQLTKYLIMASLKLGQRLPVTGFFDLTLATNPGAAFSFLAGAGGWQRWFFTGLGVCAALFIIYLLVRHAGQRLFSLALALILGGALGNVIDRVVHGQVIDFLLLYWRDWYWPAFNVADSCIVGGAAFLVLDELLRVRRTRA